MSTGLLSQRLRSALDRLVELREVEADPGTFQAATQGVIATLRDASAEIAELEEPLDAPHDLWNAHRLAGLARHIPFGLFVTNSEGRCTYVNERWTALAGIDARHALNAGWQEAIHPEDRDWVVEAWKRCAASDELFHAQFRLRSAHGVTVWVQGDGMKLVPVDGTSPSIGCIVDVSDRVHAHLMQQGCAHVLERLAAGAELHEVLETMATCAERGMPGLLCSILLLDEDGVLHHGAAPSLPDAYNQAVDGLRIGQGIGSCGTAAATGEPVIVPDIATHPYWAEYQDVARLGGVRSCWSMPIPSAEGKVLGTLAMYFREPHEPDENELEATRTAAHVAGIAIERKRTEEERRRLQAQLREVIDLVPEMIFAKTLSGQFLLANQATGDAYGKSPDELLGTAHADHHREPEELQRMMADDREVIESGRPKQITETFVDVAGNLHILRTTKIPFVSRLEQEPAVLGVAVDVTDLKRAEAALQEANQELESRVEQRTAQLSAANRELEQEIAERKRAEERARTREEELAHVMRLHTLNEMAQGLAHELNQPLAAITNYASGCLRRMKPDGSVTEELIGAIERITNQAQRAGDIIRRHREFSSKRPSVRKETDLNELATGIVQLLVGEARRAGATLELAQADPPVSATVDPIQIEQVLVNLVRNSLEAMRVADSPHREIAIRINGLPDRKVEIQVEDTGPGIHPEVRDRIFEPFFTTKPEGIGMGLTISETIVQSHGGVLHFESEVGAGARFRLTLPRG